MYHLYDTSRYITIQLYFTANSTIHQKRCITTPLVCTFSDRPKVDSLAEHHHFSFVNFCSLGGKLSPLSCAARRVRFQPWVLPHRRNGPTSVPNQRSVSSVVGTHEVSIYLCHTRAYASVPCSSVEPAVTPGMAFVFMPASAETLRGGIGLVASKRPYLNVVPNGVVTR